MKAIFKKLGRDITGILWLSIGIFLLLSLLSHDPRDPSFSSLGSGFRTSNWCGSLGAYLSDIAFQGFGLTAWLFAVLAQFKAYRIFKGDTLRVSLFGLVAMSLVIFSASSLTVTLFPDLMILQGRISGGGIIGWSAAHFLMPYLNRGGLLVVLGSILAIGSLLVFSQPLSELLRFGFPVKIFRFFFAQLAVVPKGVKNILQTKKRDERIANEDVAPAPARFSISKAFFEEAVPTPKATAPKINKPLAEPKAAKVWEQKVHTGDWSMPSLKMLEAPSRMEMKIDDKELKQRAARLVDKMEQFGIHGTITEIKPGPAVTLFEFKPNADVKISRITELADDLSLALSSESIRIIAPIPGRDVVGIETSNAQRVTVYLKHVLEDGSFWAEDTKLPLPLGRQANGEVKVVDLRKMPHLLVAGSTGSGKSVFVVSAIMGLLFRHSPKTLRLILIDPKQVDLAAFEGLPHLAMPVIRETHKAVSALRWAIREMEKRYRSMAKFNARGLESFNETVAKLSKDDLEQHAKVNAEDGADAKGRSYYFAPLPYIVIVAEEFGDLMSVDKGNVEAAVVRLAQMARACGMHLILAMQSPRKDVVTGLIKTNIPGRVSFKVASKMDSRIILDEIGAERLLARGDMLFLAPGVSKPDRHLGPWLSEGEINSVVQFWSAQGEPAYDSTAMKVLDGFEDKSGENSFGGDPYESEMDEKYDEILSYVSTLKEVSASHLQRRFRLGYPRAARVIEIMETEGVVGPALGSKPRQVLVSNLSK